MDPPLQSLVKADVVLHRAEANRRQIWGQGEGQQGRPVNQEHAWAGPVVVAWWGVAGRAVARANGGGGGGAGKRWRRRRETFFCPKFFFAGHLALRVADVGRGYFFTRWSTVSRQ